MKPEEIQAEWDAFIDYPEGSGKLYVTTTSALIFARSIVEMAEKRERDKLRTQNQALRDDREVLLNHMDTFMRVSNDPAIYNLAKVVIERFAQAEGGV